MQKSHLLAFRLSPILFAAFYGAGAYFLIYRLIARGDIFWTYTLNIVYIIIVLFLDYKARRFAERRSDELRSALYTEMSPISSILFMLTQGFNLTAMYIFYIVILVLSQVTTFKPDLIPLELGDFFTSLEYGIILLVVFDRLRELLIMDINWFEENLALKIVNKNKKE